MGADPPTARRVRELLLEFGRDRRPQALDQAVDVTGRLLADDRFDELAGTDRAVVWTLGAAALIWRARTGAAQADDLDRAIDWTQQAVLAWPAGHPHRPLAQANLATALCDRYDARADPADLDRAVTLFEAALPVLAANGERVDTARHSFGVCLHTRSGTRSDPRADLDRAIELFREAICDPAPPADERAGYLNSLGLSLRRKVQAEGDRRILAEAVATYRTAIGVAAPGGSNAQAAAANLAIALLDQADLDGDGTALREATRIYRDLMPVVDAERSAQIATNLAGALVGSYRFGRRSELLDEAVTTLRTAAERLPGGSRRQVAAATLAGALHELFEHTGELAFLDEAIALQRALLPGAGRHAAARMLNLGISLLARFRRRRDPADLDEARQLFARTATAPGASAVDLASAHNSHANAMYLVLGRSGLRTDLDEAISHRAAAIAAAVPGSLDEAIYRGNLGVDLLHRFELVGDPADLAAALAEQRAAVHIVPDDAAEQPSLLAALADALARAAVTTPASSTVEEVRSTYRAAIAAGRESQPEQALAAALRWGGWETMRRCWAEAAAAYVLGLHTVSGLVARQRARGDKESWLADAATLPGDAGYALVRCGHRHAATLAVERGRAVLLAEALSGRVLGTTS